MATDAAKPVTRFLSCPACYGATSLVRDLSAVAVWCQACGYRLGRQELADAFRDAPDQLAALPVAAVARGCNQILWG